tara:strand:+ start:571 stop:774 length:204 start_codon:yes stop_codon:yes gene_type:complete
MRVVTKQCRTSGADLHVQYRSITAIEIIPEIAIDKPLQLKPSIILENTTKLKNFKNFESACLMNSRE